MRFGFIAGTSEARERVAVATLVDGVGADQRAGRAGAVHGELVGDRIRIVLVEPEKVALLGWLGFLCRIVTKAGMTLLLQTTVIGRAQFIVGLTETAIGRAVIRSEGRSVGKEGFSTCSFRGVACPY